jgi:hypothetical protein
MVGDDDGDGKSDCRVEPIPAACCQDDRAGRSHACCRSGIRDGVEQDCRHGQVMLTRLILTLIVIAVSTEDESAASHYKRGNAAHYEYRQAAHLRCAVDEPVRRGARDQHLEDEQPPSVDERGNTRPVRAARPPCTFAGGADSRIASKATPTATASRR